MPIDVYELDKGIGAPILARGTLTSEEYLDCLTGHLSQDGEKLQGYLYSLSDYTGVTEVRLSTADVQQIAELCTRAGQFNTHAVVAVAAESDIAYGLSRMWEALCAGTAWDIRVFRSVAEARQWISDKVKEKWGIEQLNFTPMPPGVAPPGTG